jgi:hypothetical protein
VSGLKGQISPVGTVERRARMSVDGHISAIDYPASLSFGGIASEPVL